VPFGDNGYYFMPDIGVAAKTLQAQAERSDGAFAFGAKFVPQLGDPGIYRVDIPTSE
jgi:hypothetical protein